MNGLEINNQTTSKKTIFINVSLIILTILVLVFGIYFWRNNVNNNQNQPAQMNAESSENIQTVPQQNTKTNNDNSIESGENSVATGNENTSNDNSSASLSANNENTNSTDEKDVGGEAVYKYVLATVFWVGEPATADNSYIANDASAWDANWRASYGGYDDPHNRCWYRPCAFMPKENPFYFALPYDDLTKEGKRKNTALQVPWYSEKKNKITVLKNSWIEINLGNKTCYAQWEDVGPYEMDDFEYVFGTAAPKNQYGEKAGIDISPAVRDCLIMESNQIVGWRFLADSQVPQGPWKDTITTSGASW